MQKLTKMMSARPRTALFVGLITIAAFIALSALLLTTYERPTTLAQSSSVPAAPTGLTATAGNERVYLSWNNPNDPSITHYQWQMTASGLSFAWGVISGEGWDWTTIPGSNASTTHYATPPHRLFNGTPYRFRIRAVNANGNSLISNVASATPSSSITNPTDTPSPTATNTPAPTSTPTPTATSTHTPVPTDTPTATATNTPNPSNTPTATNTPAPTSTPSPTATNTPAPTSTPSPTATNTPAPTNTPSPTATNTPAPADTPTATNTPTVTGTPSIRPSTPANIYVVVGSTGTTATVTWLPGGTGVGGSCATLQYQVYLRSGGSWQATNNNQAIPQPANGNPTLQLTDLTSGDGVLVGAGVLVAVGDGVLVGAGVLVAVGVLDGFGVFVAVAVGVSVGTGVCVLVAVGVGVLVGAGVLVAVGDGVSVGFVIELDGVALATFDIRLLPLAFTALIRNRYGVPLNKRCGGVA